MRLFIGVDVGGTTTTVCLGNDQHEVLEVAGQFPTLAGLGPSATIAAIVEQILAIVERVGGDMSQVPAVGLATPGPATLDGVLLRTPNFDPEFWDNFPIRAALQDALREHAPAIEVQYIGDGQAAALGEYSIRSHHIRWHKVSADEPVPEDFTSLFMVIVGTGLGGGSVRHGRAVRGSEGRAGHVGHILLPEFAFRYEHDRQLLVGNAHATAESAVSLTGLAHQLAYRLSLPEWQDHPLNQQPGTVRNKAKQLRELASQGDPLALQLFDDQARALGITLLCSDYLGDYDLLVIGGGVCDLAPAVRDQYRQRAEKTYLQYALEGFQNLPGFEYSVCGDDAPVIGALAHVYSSNL